MRPFKTLNLFILILLGHLLYAGEFLIKDEVRVIDVNVSPWSGRTTWLFDGVGPGNWESPDNYYTGNIHIRYEIISQPTNRTCRAQMAIWQDWHDDYSFWREQASGHTTLYGQGYIATTSSSPSTWWKHDDIPLEFSRPADFHKLGIVIWSDDPFGRISAQLGPDDPEVNFYDDIWADRTDWFPMSLRITIVAVSDGSTFSGWDTYLGGGGDPGIQPDYSIDFINEETAEDILTQHEYSWDNSTWYTGAGDNLALSPGSTVYFRDKNDNGLTQTLVIDSRPAAPGFGIDYTSEVTSTGVSSDYQYSTSSSMSGAQTGTGTNIPLNPGTDMYFRQTATVSQFASAIQTLDVPSRPDAPSFTVDFINQRTSLVISSTYEYSFASDMSSAQTGTGEYIVLTPATDIYFRKLATASQFASAVQTLNVPARPDAPSFAIDFMNEQTSSVIGSAYEYSFAPDMSSAQTGTGDYIVLTPATDIYFRELATASQFASVIQMLDVPSRPSTPIFTIDYENERTSETVSPETEYSTSPDMSSAQTGSGNYLSLFPGTDVYFQQPATVSGFKSDIQHLVVPVRPATPEFSIDYLTEATSESVCCTILYSDYADFTSSEPGIDAPVDLIPGKDMYFKVKFTGSNFDSEVFHLSVPGRPVITCNSISPTTDNPILFNLDFSGSTTELSNEKIEIKNASLQAVTGEYTVELVPLAPGEVTLKVEANAVSEGNFSSDVYSIMYEEEVNGSNMIQEDEILIYPNPVSDLLNISLPGKEAQIVHLVIINTSGKVVFEQSVLFEQATVDLGKLDPGIYVLKCISQNKEAISRKLIIN